MNCPDQAGSIAVGLGNMPFGLARSIRLGRRLTERCLGRSSGSMGWQVDRSG